MAEPIEMSRARNAYAKERDHFRRDLQWALRLYGSVPINFDIKQQLRFKAADIKAECIQAYRDATKNIANNQVPLIGNNLRIRNMANSDTAANLRERSKSPRLVEDDEDVEEFIARNRASKSTDPSFVKSRGEPSIPLTKLTYGAHRSAATNTHVLSFEKQLLEDINRMINAIDGLNEENRENWLNIPKADVGQYFTTKYDNDRFSTLTYTPVGVAAPRTASTYAINTSSVLPNLSGNPSTGITSNTTGNGFFPSKARNYFDRYLQNL